MTPRTAYERTLRLFGFWLESSGRSAADDLATVLPDDLDAFVHWHAVNHLADDAEGSRKIALHVARLGSYLAIGVRPAGSRRRSRAPAAQV